MYETFKKENDREISVSVCSRRFPINVLTFYVRLFLLVGIMPTKKSKERKLFKVMGVVLFHFFWALITLKAIWTFVLLKTSILDVHALIIIEYFLCLILWWIVFLKRFHIFTAIQCLTSSRTPIGQTFGPWIHALFILFNFICFCLSTLNRVEDQDSMLRKLGTFMAERPVLDEALDSITDVTGSIILHGLPFSVALLYIACCFQAHMLISKVLKVGKKNDAIDLKSFEMCASVVRGLERGLSLAIFVFVLRSLVEFVCTLTAVINFLLGIYHQIFVAFFLQIATLYCLIVFGADLVQKRQVDLKKKLLKKIARSMRDEREGNLVMFLEVKEEDVSLTAWKMFDLDRRLLLSTVASLLTYGVILYQLKQS